MAGGPNAAAVLCMSCLGKALRVAEGLEDDQYRCEHCGAEFGVDWSHGAPTAPTWPPSEQDLAAARLLRDRIRSHSQRPAP